jgi:hypothetical protein
LRIHIPAIALGLAVILFSCPTRTYGQDASASQGQSSSNAKPRVFVRGHPSPSTPASAAATAQMAEIGRTFGQKCEQVQIESGPDVADYLVELVSPDTNGASHHKGKVVVMDRRSGDPVGGKSAVAMDMLLADACGIITVQWAVHSSELLGMREIENVLEPHPGATPQAAPNNTANVSITSNPSGADIQIDGNYVGSTPSEVKLPPGTVLIKIQKKGFNAWERRLKISGGDVKVSADLDASAAPH